MMEEERIQIRFLACFGDGGCRKAKIADRPRLGDFVAPARYAFEGAWNRPWSAAFTSLRKPYEAPLTRIALISASFEDPEALFELRLLIALRAAAHFAGQNTSLVCSWLFFYIPNDTIKIGLILYSLP